MGAPRGGSVRRDPRRWRSSKNKQARQTPETTRDSGEQTVTSDTSRSVKTKLSSSVDSSASISWHDNFTSSELWTIWGGKRPLHFDRVQVAVPVRKPLDKRRSVAKHTERLVWFRQDIGPPNAGTWSGKLIATMPGSRPQFSLSQMLFVFPTEGTSGRSGVFPLEESSGTELLSVLAIRRRGPLYRRSKP